MHASAFPHGNIFYEKKFIPGNNVFITNFWYLVEDKLQNAEINKC